MTRPVSLPPAMLRLVRQTAMHEDCGVATLATLCGLTYDEALVACSAVAPRVLEQGMSWRELRLAARRVSVAVRVLRRGQYDPEEATGILNVFRRGEDHFAFLWAGRVADGNGELWLDVEDYVAHYGYRRGSLLVRADAEA